MIFDFMKSYNLPIICYDRVTDEILICLTPPHLPIHF